MAANIPADSFLILPPELRLRIYRYHITSCLVEGRALDIGSLYLACATIQSELEAEYISTLRPLFNISTHRHGKRLPPRIKLPDQLPDHGNILFALQNATISIPRVRVDCQPEPWLSQIFRLDFSFSTLTLETEAIPSCEERLFDQRDTLFHLARDVFGAAAASGGVVAEKLNRLILEYSTDGTPRFLWDWDSSMAWTPPITWHIGVRGWKCVRRVWVTREKGAGYEIWKLGFDLKDGMDKAKGEEIIGVWEI